uniref:Interferon-induced protein 44-like n=1 Tax=Echeneis naucrates TaxID=173247 RepID=A0A665T9R1_ECHNA
MMSTIFFTLFVFYLSVLDEPWREVNWSEEKQRDLQYVKNYKPPTEGQQVRILLHGPAGSGKSSFINSVQSVLNDRMYRQALADNISGSSFTKKYTTYKVPKDKDTFYPFVFNDIMGLESREQGGVHVDDVKLALKGHMKEDYQLNPQSKLSEENLYYNKSPKPNNKVQVLVLIIPADTLAFMKNELVQKIREILMAAADLAIPQIALITKIDQACPEISRDLKNVYRSKYLKRKMQQLSTDVGIPMNCIFTVKNYHEETKLNNDVDTLILNDLTQIITCGDDYLKFLLDQSD